MSRAQLLVLVQVFFFVFSSAHLLVAASESDVQSDEGATCADASVCGDPTDARVGANDDSVIDESGAHEETKDDVTSPWAFMNAFSKLGSSWNHIIGEYISVVKGADGVDLKGDIHARTLDEGVGLLQSMVQEAASTSNEDKLAWSFHTTPLIDFGKSIDDVLLAFLRWSVVDKSSHDGDSCQLIGGINAYPSSTPAANGDDTVDEDTITDINVSKAFRRLQSYIHWMKSVSLDLVDPPLTIESISPSLSTFSIYITHDACGRLIWWVDLGKTDLSAFKSISPRETTRLFVWVAHLLFLDEGAQTKGLVVIDDMARISFWDYMTMLPIQVGISVDRFLISVTPLKAKNVVLMHLPRWAEIGYGLLSWFLTGKMKSRVTMVTKGEEIETIKKVVGGVEFIPADFGSFGGQLQADMIGDMHVGR